MSYTQAQIEATKTYRHELRAEWRELLKIKELHKQPEKYARSLELGNLVTHWDMVVDKVLGGREHKRYEKNLGITLEVLG